MGALISAVSHHITTEKLMQNGLNGQGSVRETSDHCCDQWQNPVLGSALQGSVLSLVFLNTLSPEPYDRTEGTLSKLCS